MTYEAVMAIIALFVSASIIGYINYRHTIISSESLLRLFQNFDID